MKETFQFDAHARCTRENWGPCLFRQEGKCPFDKLIDIAKRFKITVDHSDPRTRYNTSFDKAEEWKDHQRHIRNCDKWHKVDPFHNKDYIYWADPQPVNKIGKSVWSHH